MDWIPTEYYDGALLAVAALVALRTALRALVAVLDWADGLDGRADWEWLHAAANALDRFDALLDRLPVKAPITRAVPRVRGSAAWDRVREH